MPRRGWNGRCRVKRINARTKFSPLVETQQRVRRWLREFKGPYFHVAAADTQSEPQAAMIEAAMNALMTPRGVRRIERKLVEMMMLPADLVNGDGQHATAAGMGWADLFEPR